MAKKSLSLEIPEYLTIKQYSDMNSYKGQNKFGRLVHTVAALTGYSKEEVRRWDVDSLIEVSNLYADVADHKDFFHPIIEWNGKLYGYASVKKCSLGEYIDLENYAKDMENSMHKVAAILYRPVTSHKFNDILFNVKQGIKVARNKVSNVFDWYDIEEYDSSKRLKVEEEYKDFPVNLFLGGVSFFLSSASLYLNHIAYLRGQITKRTMMKAESLMMESLSLNTGDGLVRYTHSLKPMFYKLQETSA